MHQCLQDNVAYLAAASQQAEQSQLGTSAPSGAPGLATPPKHSVQLQQPSENSPGAASPLPPVPGKGALSSVRYSITRNTPVNTLLLKWMSVFHSRTNGVGQ